MLWRSFVIFFTLIPSDFNTTLTYVLIDNFCPCFRLGIGSQLLTELVVVAALKGFTSIQVIFK